MSKLWIVSYTKMHDGHLPSTYLSQWGIRPFVEIEEVFFQSKSSADAFALTKRTRLGFSDVRVTEYDDSVDQGEWASGVQ